MKGFQLIYQLLGWLHADDCLILRKMDGLIIILTIAFDPVKSPGKDSKHGDGSPVVYPHFFGKIGKGQGFGNVKHAAIPEKVYNQRSNKYD
ncbi:hypothetical protein ACFL02_03410 [Planctomycetota bacterium]